MAHLRIEVTSEDIENGTPCESDICPVALALNRATGKRWYVDYGEARLGQDASLVALPPKAREFISRFDRETGFGATPLDIEPFSFDLEVPNEILK